MRISATPSSVIDVLRAAIGSKADDTAANGKVQ